MKNIRELAKQYQDTDIADLTGRQKKQLSELLNAYEPGDLVSIQDHKDYLMLLSLLRRATREDMKLEGQNFLKTLSSLLSVGEDGVYSNRLRFLYELIQNVDDCEYDDVSNCHLEIQFDYNEDPGKIILTYNEKGFTPQNVFAITGIAAASKNIKNGKTEIGEKGIGFKSVFGIARRVLIQSGKFSFALKKDSFTIPEACYDRFQPVQGTRLTLEMDRDTCEEIYKELVTEYSRQDVILNKNPILFLNKLTYLKLYQDPYWRYLEFIVERKEPVDIGGIYYEPDVAIRVNMKNHVNGMDRDVPSTSIRCDRYTMPIVYGRAECQSRYGGDTAFTERHHNLIAIFPDRENLPDSYTGVMYSFLPTQIHLQAPVILHVPFKLDGSREFVDPQGKNAWFKFTVDRLGEFISRIYQDYAHRVKENIVYYLPSHGRYFVRDDNEKVRCLKVKELKADRLYQEPLFHTVDDSFEEAKNVTALCPGIQDHYPDLVQVHRLLGLQKKLFLAPPDVNMEGYDIQVVKDLTNNLFWAGMRHVENLDEILTLQDGLEKKAKPDYSALLEKHDDPVQLTPAHLAVIAKHKYAVQEFLGDFQERITKDKKLKIVLDPGELKTYPAAVCARMLRESQQADLNPRFLNYLESIGGRIYQLDTETEDFAFAAQNGIVLGSRQSAKAYSALVKAFDRNGTFAASLQIQNASERLNQADDDLSKRDYMSLLREVRLTLVHLLRDGYQSYLNLINESGTDKTRFLSELIQNADDCTYPEGEIPTFDLQQRVPADPLIVTYNETGFTKNNVRALTAIGESTKKKLLRNDLREEIGEKGVGFKSVFGVAQSVRIQSNGFDFILKDERPTVPERTTSGAAEEEEVHGTRMMFTMKEDVRHEYDNDRLLKICLCLRHLKRLNIFGHLIQIDDTPKSRTISIDSAGYAFEKKIYKFEISDREALEERNGKGRTISRSQMIVCYLPRKGTSWKMGYCVYSGLPLNVTSNVPVIIDAPFELTTSREEIQHTRWNELVRGEIYKALLQLIEEKSKSGLDALRFVGFRSAGGEVKWENFSDPYLNAFHWVDSLKEIPIVKVLGSEERVQPGPDCVIVPDFIADVVEQQEKPLSWCVRGTVVDTRKKSQYVSLLTELGCRKISATEMSVCLDKLVPQYISTNRQFRDKLYDYLSGNQGSVSFDTIGEHAKALRIIPVKYARKKIEYVSYSDHIYISPQALSDDDNLILAENILPVATLEKIVGERISELTDDVLTMRYMKNLKMRINNPGEDPKKLADDLYKDFLLYPDRFREWQDTMVGMQEKIPLRFMDGKYRRGHCFLNEDEDEIQGGFLKSYIVHPLYLKFAEYLKLRDYKQIHVEDLVLDNNVPALEDIDVEELGQLGSYVEVSRTLYEEGLISDVQVEKYHLIIDDTSDDGEDDEDRELIPHPIRSKELKRIQNAIRMQWRDRNKYVPRQYVRWVPERPVTSTEYLDNNYEDDGGDRRYCQMCGRWVKKRYSMKCSLEKEPVYAWKQMHVCLCLNCGKNFTYYRNNGSVWNQFLKAVMKADVTAGDPIDIPIGFDDQWVTFTAHHLAEIQEILKLEGYGKNAPKRPHDQNTDSDVVSDDSTDW